MGSPKLDRIADQANIQVHQSTSQLNYISTRGGESLTLAQILTRGTAKDGGLFVPESWPAINQQQLDELLEGEYAEIAGRVLAHFGGDTLPGNVATNAIHAAMQSFAAPVGPPVTALEEGLWALELIHGPTLAFKDFALAPLAEIIAQTLKHQNRQATVLCATSGDTGAATVSAFANRENLNAVVLFPAGGVSDFQRKQMTTTGAKNVLTLCVDGDFDTCQNIVKALYQTEAATQYSYTAVNSINMIRILLQTAYYFRSSGIVKAKTGKPSNFVVPTGNFGNIYAAYIAKQMGAPVNRLIITSNDNDVLPRLFDSSSMQGQQTIKTISPSMDIQVSSNFERLLWHIKSGDGSAVQAAQQSLESDNGYELSGIEMLSLMQDFSAVKCSEAEANDAMLYMQTRFNKTVCPHTATAVHAIRQLLSDTDASKADAETILVETAHPAKFSAAVEKATGVKPTIPVLASDMMNKKESFVSVAATASAVQSAIDTFLATA